MVELKINDMVFDIIGEYEDSIKGFPNNPTDENYHNQFKVTVTNAETKQETDFKFYGSANDCMEQKTELDDRDLLFCFRCFIDDAIAGQDTFPDFCSNFGYDLDSRRAENIHKACLETVGNAEKIGICSDDLYKIINALSDQGIE